ncbi:hypothetical protein [Changchengzhania lutea]|uniref:hypothetical protein n=1 Tax=Changchengzhania lutea TaxID=2049305 RepID=UPI001FEA6ED1|nr:hypothetical protein [Changchengzhania lutea]
MLQVLLDSFDVDDVYRKYKGEDVKTEITILGAYVYSTEFKLEAVRLSYQGSSA